MLNKKDLQAINTQFVMMTHDQQESADYKRGVRAAMLVLFDTLRNKNKHDTAEMLATGV